MGDVLNLRQARKAKARSQSEAQAASNRLAHGRTRAERQALDSERERSSRLLDGVKREPE